MRISKYQRKLINPTLFKARQNANNISITVTIEGAIQSRQSNKNDPLWLSVRGAVSMAAFSLST